MSFRLNRRRSSSINSSHLVSSLKRRSSITSYDLEHIQAILQKRKQLTTPFIFLILSGSPVFIFCYQIIISQNGTITELLTSEISIGDLHSQIYQLLFNPVPWSVMILLVQLQLLFLWHLPAVEQEAVSVSGQKFRSRHNCFDSFVLVCLLYVLGASVGIYEGDIVYTNWISIMVVLSIVAAMIQVYLFTLFADASAEQHGNDTTFISEVFFGRHLQPIVFEIDVKTFITNRIMLTIWPLYIISALYYQKRKFGALSDALIACAALQLIYVARRQWFEYVMRNLDYGNDRMGFYRIWGVLVFLPTIYLTPVTYLAQTKDGGVSKLICISLFAVGLVFQYLNTVIDLQKYQFRNSNGQWKLGDKDPYYITAKYRKESGEAGTELLLGSGYWGKARHLNYTTEFLTYLTWSLLAKSFVTYVPTLFLAVLLYGRMTRNETRCLMKYTYSWLQYVSRVPYLIVPGVI